MEVPESTGNIEMYAFPSLICISSERVNGAYTSTSELSEGAQNES